MIEIRHLRKQFQEETPIKDITVNINDGDVISIIGPSGTGKSTLLRMINMLSKPTSGQIIVDNEDITDPNYDITKARKKIGMVFQSFNLFPHITVLENIMKPQIELLNRTKQEAYDKAMSLLERVGLTSEYSKYPFELSGGQKQRIAICRTLAMDPEIILFDEPTSALDPTMVYEVQSVIKDLAKKGHTMLIVTHELDFAKDIANRILYLDEGGVYEDGTPDQIFNNPQKEKTIRFIKKLKTLEFLIESSNFDFRSIVYKIDDYIYKNNLNKHLANQIQSSFEELCKEIIIPTLKDKVYINVTIEYDKKDNTITMEVKYNGNTFNPLDSNNEIAIKILKNNCKEIEHTTITEDQFTNKVIIKF